jgi:hypothetical protein
MEVEMVLREIAESCGCESSAIHTVKGKAM